MTLRSCLCETLLVLRDKLNAESLEPRFFKVPVGFRNVFVVHYKRLHAVEVFLYVFPLKKHKLSQLGSVRRTTRGAGHVGVVEDVGDVEHFRKNLDAVVDVGEAGDERREQPADVFTQWSSASRSPHGSGGQTFEDSALHSSVGLMDL